MKLKVKIVMVIAASMSCAVAAAQSPAEIFREIDTHKRASFAGVENYTQIKSTMGICTVEYFEKESTQSTDGRGNVDYMRSLSLSEIAERNAAESPLQDASPEELEAIAAKLRAASPEMESVYRQELASSNLPGGLSSMLMNPPTDEPWLSPSPNDVLNNYAIMLEGAAGGKRLDAAQKAAAKSEASRDRYADVAAVTRIGGRESFDGRDATLLFADNLDYRQESEGQVFTINTLRLWVDTAAHLPVKMSVGGVATDGQESRDLVIEREDYDFRPVAGCGSLLEPHRSVMRIAGIFNAEQRAQMAQAQQQLAEFETQMASMPPSQQAMIRSRMGPQMEVFKSMASGSGMEVVSEIVAMRCNAGPPSNEEIIATVPGMSAEGCRNTFASGSTGSAPGPASGGGDPNTGNSGAGGGSGGTATGTAIEIDSNLIKRIQVDLQTLGYDPGNTDGILTKQTIVAITQFEAANGMPVTGKATPQLAGILAAKVNAMQ